MFRRMVLKRVSGAVQRLENATKKQNAVKLVVENSRMYCIKEG